MAVTKVYAVKRRARTAARDSMWRRTYTAVYAVETNDPTDEGPLILGATDPVSGVHVPWVGTYYRPTPTNSDAGSFVQSVSAQEEGEDGLSWLVTVTYGPYDAGSFGANPTAWPLKVQFGGTMREKVLYYSQAGNPIVNSAGDHYEDPIAIEDPRYTMVVTRNELVSTFDVATASTFGGTLNLNDWNGFAAKTVKLGLIQTSEPTYDSNNQVYFYTVTYPFDIAEDWGRELLNQGYNQLVGGALTPILYKGQKPDVTPLLDDSGVCLRDNMGVLRSGAVPTSIIFDVWPAVDWAPLGINLATRLGH